MQSHPASTSDRARFPLYEEYVKQYGIGRSNPAKDPYWDRKDRPWWPMRYFMGDWILAVWVYRIKPRNPCEVGLFLAEDHTLYVKDSGIKGGLISLLTQTFHQTRSMEVRFVGPRRGQEATLETGFEPVIPESIRRIAVSFGLTFARRSRITDAEGRALYARLTGFSEETVRSFEQRGIDLTRACFLVQHDVWSFDQVEFLLRHARAPERIFDGGAPVTHRLIYQQDLILLRLALMEERVRTLLARLAGPSEAVVEAEWLTPGWMAYRCDHERSVRTIRGEVRIPAGEPRIVRLLPRDAQGYQTFWESDRRESARGAAHLVAVTRDFASSTCSARPPVRGDVLPLYDTLSDLDLVAERRLARTVSTRSPLSEHQE